MNSGPKTTWVQNCFVVILWWAGPTPQPRLVLMSQLMMTQTKRVQRVRVLTHVMRPSQKNRAGTQACLKCPQWLWFLLWSRCGAEVKIPKCKKRVVPKPLTTAKDTAPWPFYWLVPCEAGREEKTGAWMMSVITHQNTVRLLITKT